LIELKYLMSLNLICFGDGKAVLLVKVETAFALYVFTIAYVSTKCNSKYKRYVITFT